MTAKEIVLLGNPNLRKKSDKVTDFTEDLKPILQDLKEALTNIQEASGMGRGIAAPQLGYLKRVVYIRMPERSFYLVNPEILWRSHETFDVWDSCFSMKAAFFVKIPRNKEIRVMYQDEKGKEQVEEFSDSLSELLQHEIDHLEGIVCTDHLKDAKDIIMREEWEKRYRKIGIGM